MEMIMGFISRFITAFRAAYDAEASESRNPGCDPAETTIHQFTGEQFVRAAEEGMRGESGRYLAWRADNEASAQEFAEQYGSGYL
jgi:hypothetical protein